MKKKFKAKIQHQVQFGDAFSGKQEKDAHFVHQKTELLHLYTENETAKICAKKKHDNSNDVLTEQELISACLQENKLAQKLMYERYAPLLFGVARRYLSAREDAEEALLNTLFKALTQLERYSGTGSFEGWLRRIAVNEALMILRTKKKLIFPLSDALVDLHEEPFSVEDDISAREIMGVLNQLPDGYRTVFNLYVLEGYKHQEIADLLGVSINTSKSQLIAAKQRMRELLPQNTKNKLT